MGLHSTASVTHYHLPYCICEQCRPHRMETYREQVESEYERRLVKARKELIETERRERIEREEEEERSRKERVIELGRRDDEGLDD